MTDQSTVTKAPAKKAVAKKAPAKKAVAKKAPAKKAAPAKATASKPKYTAAQVYNMIQQAAYFAAENDGFAKEPTEYWVQAEASINAMIK
jgi:hypothetical protein